MLHTLGEIAEYIGAELRGEPSCQITGLATLPNAECGQLTFLSNHHYLQYLASTRASAVIVGKDDGSKCPVQTLVVDDPYLAYAKAARLLNPAPVFPASVDESASVHKSAVLGPGVYVGPRAVVLENTKLGAGVYVGAGAVIGPAAEIGDNSKLAANVTLCERVSVGSRVIIHPGAVIGADGFGIARDGDRWLKIPQMGRVIIHDDVEIGANTAIDRGALDDTVIEEGVKIDNLVQIGHNCRIGAHTAIAGCAVIAGSVTIGKRCMIGGASALTGHITIADDVVITGMSGVASSISRAGVYSSGMPAIDNLTWRRNMVRLKELDRLARRLRALETRLDKMEPGE